jgi:copper chaperone CopZ
MCEETAAGEQGEEMRAGIGSLVLVLLCLNRPVTAEVKSISVSARGVYCVTCTYRLEKAIQRLGGIEKVHALVDPARAEVTPRAGAWVEAERLRGAVKEAGFKPGDVRYTLAGTLTTWQGQPAVRVTGCDRLLVLQPLPGTPAAFEQAQRALPLSEGKTIVVEGQLADSAGSHDKAAPAALRVTRVEMAGS